MPNQNDKRRDSEKSGQGSPNQDEQRFGQQQEGQSPSRQAGNQSDDNDLKSPRKSAGGDESSSGGDSDRDESREASTDTSRGRKGP